MRSSYLLIIIPLVLTGCNSYCSELQWGYSDSEFDHYSVDANLITPQGTPYDPTGQPISPELIDRLTGEVETCLATALPGNILSKEIISNSHCSKTIVELPIPRQSFSVKIPNDWVLNCDGTEQVLPTPVMAGGLGCVAKGQTPSAQCPCRWRAGIKCPNTLIATPSMYLYKDVLIRFTTGCQNPWASPELAACATPSTTPLNNGTDPNNGL